MKRILLLACIAGMAVSPALAGMTAHLSAGHGDPFPIGQGGYYTVYRTGDMAAWNAAGLSADFRTFCVEQRVFYDGTQYNVTIDDQVLQLGPKPIQTFTKTLYANYILAPGSTIGQNTIGESGFSNRAFQALIWDSQGTISGTAGQFGGGHANAYAWLTGPEKLLYIICSVCSAPRK